MNVCEVGLELLFDEFVVVVSHPDDDVVCKHSEFGFDFFNLADVVEECGTKYISLRDPRRAYLHI